MTDPGQPGTEVPGAGTAAENVSEMSGQLADAGVAVQLGEFERRLAKMMSDAEAAFAAQQQQLDAQRQQLAGQIQAARAQAGPPEALLLSESLAKRVQSIAAANPDIHPIHFHGVLDQANRLDEAVKAAADGSGPVADAERLAHSVITFFERTHPKATSKVLEGAHTAVDEAERILGLLADLAPVAEAVIAAV